MPTLTIPLTTLPAGSRDFGPVAFADNATSATLTIDRTVAGGLETKAVGSTIIEMSVQQSNDNGATWLNLADARMTGGVVDDSDGTHMTTTSVGTGPNPGTSRQARAHLVVSATVAVAGSLVVT